MSTWPGLPFVFPLWCRRGEGAIADDPIHEFFESGYHGLVGWVAGRSPGGSDVEAAIQEALLLAWLQPPGHIQSLEAWVRVVALNLVRTAARRRDAESRALQELSLVAVEPGDLDRVLERSNWSELLSQLPDGQRRSVILHYFEDRSVEDVATQLGVTAGTVKRHLHRARAALAGLVPAPPGRLPPERRTAVKAWYMSGSHPHDYEHELVDGETYDGKRVVRIRNVAPSPGGFATLMQQCLPDDYRGRRVRFSGAVRSRKVKGWAGLWLRVDGEAQRNPLAFDNMQDRAVTGTTDWRRYDVVLDVASTASLLAYGVILHGPGEIEVADFRLEPVDFDVPTTDRSHRLERPTNLDFSED